MTIEIPGFKARGHSKQLIVLLHAYMSSPQKLRSLQQVVEQEFPDADLYIPTLPASGSSIARPTDIINRLLDDIDNIVNNRQQASQPMAYEKILLIGHSLGALLARKLYICACGETPTAPIEEEISAHTPRLWAEQVERIILLAGMNRGWRISHHLSVINAILWTIGTLWGNILWLFCGRPPLIFTIRKGAAFITQLRIHWIHMRNSAKERNRGSALTIQLLGSIDDMVSPQDNIDLVSGHDFVYLDVPYSGHANVINMDDPSALPSIDAEMSKGVKTVGAARAEVFKNALLKSKDLLIQESIIPSDLPPEKQRHNVTDVAFVIHGIRDKGYWTHKIARRILLLARKQKIEGVVYATETSSYGYFPMLPFLLPTKRREKVEWMMDQYAEALALYPNAQFSFVGHSNGTYLLTRALRDYPVCRFKNVVLAGSVVRTRYDWKSVIAKGQVKNVLNYVATADWVVAFFPRAIQMLRIQDLGSAGHDGFQANALTPQVGQVKYVKGGHGAALNEANWDAIAHFVLTGNPQHPPPSIQSTRQSWLIKLPGFVAPLIWLVILALIVLACRSIWCLQILEWQKTLLLVAFSGALWKLITVL